MPRLFLLLVLLLGTAWADTGQPRSDRVVGYWRSSSGVEVTLAYTGRPESLLVQVQTQPPKEYTATWTSDLTFQYPSDATTVTARFDPKSGRIQLSDGKGWSASWSRRS